MITLYDYALSGNCFKVRQLLAWLDVEHDLHPVDYYPGFEHRSDAFSKINPLGQLPVIDDDGQIIRDAQAILIYLAAAYDPSAKWYPRDKAGAIQQWLAFADGISASISAARLHDAMFFDVDIEHARAAGIDHLRLLDDHLWFAERDGGNWLCPGDHPSIADLACFPYVALAEEGGIDLAPCGAVQRWIEDFMRLDGFKPMAGMMPLTMPRAASM